jgi:hypothetical protein
MNDACEQLHRLLRDRSRFVFPYDDSAMCRNGVYVLFEAGETGHGGERIVRVGTHTGDDNLCGRLKEHFLNPNKDRSIFRKNVGRALLNRDGDPFLAGWDTDRTTHKARAGSGLIATRQQEVQLRVTDYIQRSLTFCVVEIRTKAERRRWEDLLIATVAQCPLCAPSAIWLGRHSPLKKISDGKLWQVQGIAGNTLDAKTISELILLL